MQRYPAQIETETVGQGIIRLNEYDLANCFLVVGEEKACLIDTGAGVADLKKLIPTLTDKPLTVLITHAHADHVGGAGWFREAYVHPADLHAAKRYRRPFWRLYFLHCHPYKRKQHAIPFRTAFQKAHAVSFLPCEEGAVFPLGGREIETFFTPGHSVGSLIFRDTLTGTVFAGDNVNPLVTLQYPGATTVRTWIAGASRTLQLAGGAPIWGGHGNTAIPQETIEKAVLLAQTLVDRGNGKTGKTRSAQGDEKYPRILYKENRVV
ncbi:MAG: MBL fold metallo-hydrolase [Clostridia bacterium]|nr:MBL fold metallo-hydrolase [Clostridia bacterium]